MNASAARERANLQAFGFTGFGDVNLENPTFTLYSIGGGMQPAALLPDYRFRQGAHMQH